MKAYSDSQLVGMAAAGDGEAFRVLVEKHCDIVFRFALGNRQVLKANPVVLIRLEADSKPVYITAYSGQTIETKIGGRTLRMEILTTSDREGLVASDEFMLERGVLYGPETYRADARVLEARL